MGMICTLGGLIVSWALKDQPYTTLSSTEAEYYSLSAAAKDLVLVENVIQEIGTVITSGVIYCNNEAAVSLVKN